MKISKLTLGTVQFGLDYGINNRIGKPTLQQSLEILNHAYMNGINSFDTAQAYNDSECIIGQWVKESNPRDIFITTKVSSVYKNKIKDKDLEQYLEEKIYTSLEKMNVDVIDNLLLHDYEDFRTFGTGILDAMMRLKEKKLVKKVGVSLYEINELEQSIKYNIDSIQIPSSLFDHRFINSGLLEVAKRKNILIFCRSVFVQGLVFIKNEEIPASISNIRNYLDILNEISISNNMSKQEIALNFLKQKQEIDSILIGVDSVEQLEENLLCFNSDRKIEDNILYKLFGNIPIDLIDPRKWTV